MTKIRQLLKEYSPEIFIVIFFVALHLPSLGHEIFNTDVWKWKARTYDFGQGIFTLDFEKTIQKYHPGVTLMWIGTASVKVYNLYYDLVFGHPPVDNAISTVFELHFVQKLFLVASIGVVLGFIIHVLKKLFGKRVALVFGILVSLEPFYYALTRVFHLEGLMSTLMIASFLWFYYYLQERKPARLILSAIFASLAFLTKTSAVYLIPFTFLMVFLDTFGEWKGRPTFKQGMSLFKPFGVWLLLASLGFVLFWPAMWTHPSKSLSTIYRGIFTIGMERGHEQLYFGKLTENPGNFYYLVVLGLRSSVFLFLGLLGSIIPIRYGNKSERKFILYAFLFAIFYTIQITIPSKKLDRYVLPAILSLSLISSFFYAYIISGKLRKIGMCTFITALILGVFNIFFLDRDYFSYFNPLFGDLETGIKVLEPKWIIGHHEIISFFKKIPLTEEKVKIAFPEKYYTQIWPFIKEIGYEPVIKDLTPLAKDSRYFVYPVWQDESCMENRVELSYLDTIYLREVPVWNVYIQIFPN